MGRKILRMQRFLHEARVHAYWYMHRRNIDIMVRWEHAEKVIHLEDIVVQDKLTQILVAYFL